MAHILKTCVVPHRLHILDTCKFSLGRLLSTQGPTQNHYDIIVAGGGMIGTTLACTLGKNTRLSYQNVLLLEGGKQKDYKLSEKYSNRVSSLNAGTVSLLNSLNVWPHIEQARVGVVNKMRVWDIVSEIMLTFDSKFTDSGFVSYIVENDVLLASVMKELKNLENVKVVNDAKIKEYHLPHDDNEMSKVTLQNGETYTCKLLLFEYSVKDEDDIPSSMNEMIYEAIKYLHLEVDEEAKEQ